MSLSYILSIFAKFTEIYLLSLHSLIKKNWIINSHSGWKDRLNIVNSSTFYITFERYLA